MATQPYTQTPGFHSGAAYQQRSGPLPDHSQPRLTYFITRTPSGLPVPLIPADELPFTVKLHNVSRVLQPQDTYGLQYVGTSPYTGTMFKLDSGAAASSMQRSNSQPPNEPGHSRSQSSTPSKQFLAPDALVRQAHANNNYAGPSISAMHCNTRPSETATTWRRSEPISTTSTQGVIDAILRSEAGAETAERSGYRSRNATPPPPSGIVPDQDKKVFCTHWIMTGDCKFVQQGCRYKHEMPSEAKLKELGIRHTPRWWQEQTAAIKLGGSARTTVGSTMAPLEMLSRGSKGDGDEDDDSSSDESEVVEMVRPAPVNNNIILPVIGPKQTLQPNKTPAPIPTRRLTPATEQHPASDLRKASTASDLIDFSSTTTRQPPSLAPMPVISRPTTTITTPKPTLVFVPAGESPKAHIAAMKKRERVTTRVKTSSPSTSSSSSSSFTPTVASRSQPQSVMESSSAVKIGITTPSTSTSTVGVGASVAAASPKKRSGNTTNTNTANRAGCRVRRVVVASPSAVISSGGNMSGRVIGAGK